MLIVAFKEIVTNKCVPMQISTQQVFDAVASMSERFKPREKTLQTIRQFAYTYRVENGQAYCLN